jgi:hypothetical protein
MIKIMCVIYIVVMFFSILHIRNDVTMQCTDIEESDLLSVLCM